MVTKLLILSSVLLSLNLSAQNVESLTAEGSARIEWDSNQARDLATTNAYKDAIRKTLIATYGEQAVMANELKLTPLYDDAKRYVVESQQLMEKEDTALKMFSIKLNVNVDKDALQDYLSEKGISLTAEKGMMILPLIVEKTGEADGDFWWKDSKDPTQKKSFSDVEKGLSLYFAQSGYALIDPYQNSLSSSVPSTHRYMELKNPELIELGKTFNVGLIANGYAKTDCKKDDLIGKTTCSTALSIQMISTDTGKIIAAKRSVETGSAQTESEAKIVSRAKACQAVAAGVLTQMTRRWQKKNASSYKIVLKGIKDYPSYAKLRACLVSGTGGLSNTIERYMAKGYIVFEAEKRGAANTGQNILNKCFPEGNASIIDEKADLVEIKL